MIPVIRSRELKRGAAKRGPGFWNDKSNEAAGSKTATTVVDIKQRVKIRWRCCPQQQARMWIQLRFVLTLGI